MRHLILPFVLGAAVHAQTTIHVPRDYDTIQAAIDAAAASSVIVVAPGVYEERIDFKGKSIRVQSSGGPHLTMLNGQSKGTVVRFVKGEKRTSVLQGFTITGGRSLAGGGIDCVSSSPTIRDCLLTGNTATNGGGMRVTGSGAAPLVERTSIINNSANNDSGGGIISSDKARPSIVACVIAKNTATVSGGGVSCHYSSVPTITNSTIVYNTAGRGEGGGILSWNSAHVHLHNTILWGNQNKAGAQIFVNKATSAKATVEDCCVQGGYAAGKRIVTGDPRFSSPANGNYHLLRTSPCVNAGSNSAPGRPALDIDEQSVPWPANGSVDIGADEYSRVDNVRGAFGYRRPGKNLPLGAARHVLVELRTAEVVPRTLASGKTNAEGEFRFTYSGPSRKLYVHVQARTEAGMCGSLFGLYGHATAAQTVDPDDPGSCEFESKIFEPADVHAPSHAWYALDSQLEAYFFLRKHRVTTLPPPVPILYPDPDPTNSGAVYRTWPFNLIALSANVLGWDHRSVFHEYGHAVMQHLYGGFPLPPGGGSCAQAGRHVPTDHTTPCLALIEGWATFFQIAVANDVSSVAYKSVSLPCPKVKCSFYSAETIESNSWWQGSGCPTVRTRSGLISEGAVASILWDIYDADHNLKPSCRPDDEGFREGLNGPGASIWQTLARKPHAMTEFFEAWRELGFGKRLLLAGVFQSHGVATLDVPERLPIASSLLASVVGQPGNQFVLGTYDSRRVARPGAPLSSFEGGLLLGSPLALLFGSIPRSGIVGRVAVPIPNDKALVGVSFHSQALVSPPGSSGVGWFTNRCHSQITN